MKKHPNRYKAWSASESRKLADHIIAGRDLEVLVKVLGRTKQAIHRKAWEIVHQPRNKHEETLSKEVQPYWNYHSMHDTATKITEAEQIEKDLRKLLDKKFYHIVANPSIE